MSLIKSQVRLSLRYEPELSQCAEPCLYYVQCDKWPGPGESHPALQLFRLTLICLS